MYTCYVYVYASLLKCAALIVLPELHFVVLIKSHALVFKTVKDCLQNACGRKTSLKLCM